MDKISTREEINLLYLESSVKLRGALLDGYVQKSHEVLLAIKDLGDPTIAYYYAECIHRDPCRSLLYIICKSPQYAYYYAKYLTRRSGKLTRKGACKSASYAYFYALNVDEKPSVETRKGACSDPLYAFYYAKHVDKKPRKDTREAAYKNFNCKEEYMLWEKSLQKKK